MKYDICGHKETSLLLRRSITVHSELLTFILFSSKVRSSEKKKTLIFFYLLNVADSFERAIGRACGLNAESRFGPRVARLSRTIQQRSS